MSIYKKGKAKSGETRWQIVLHHKGMRRDYKFVGSKTDATEFEAQRQIELAQADPSDPRTVPTFSAFCLERYTPFAMRELAPQTWSHRRYQLAALEEFFGHLRLSEVGNARHVSRYQRMRLDDDIGAVTVNDDMKVLRAVLSYAVKQNFRITIPRMERLKEVRVKGNIVPWTGEQLQALFASLKTHSAHLLPLVIFLANTGCRKTEALRLRSKSVDLKSGVVNIEPSADWTPKDNEARQVPISTSLRPILESRLDHEFVFRSEDGQPWVYWPQLAFDRARDATTPDAVREEHAKDHKGEIRECFKCRKYLLLGGPHMLRHTYASRFLAAGGDMFTLAKILGHSHERTTAIYAHLMPGAVQRAAALVSIAPALESIAA